MAHEVTASGQAGRDLADIVQFLYDSFRSFGDDDARAFDRAESRIREITTAMTSLGPPPHQGTLRPELGEGIRSVTKGRAIYYFETQDEKRTLFVLAVFFGGQENLRAMLARMTNPPISRN